MCDKKELTDNADKLHTTEAGVVRIRKNTGITDADIVEYCRKLVLRPDCGIYRKGKNWYCESKGIRLTINAKSFTVITAHTMKNQD
jgi:hypothetical protein